MAKNNESKNLESIANSHPAVIFSILLIVTLIVQSAGGLFIKGLYRDNNWVVSIYYGTDLITLVLVVPVLIAALMLGKRGSARAQLIWTGTMYYAFYNNMYFLGSAFNRFFLVYVALFVLSSFAIVAVLLNIDARRIGESFCAHMPRKSIATVLFLNAAVLGVMWIGQSLHYITSGELPQLIGDTGGVTNMVAVYDLSMIVPLYILGGIWLWRSRPWGYVVSAIMLIQSTLITTVLVVAAPFQAAAGVPNAWMMVPLWALMGVSFLAASIILLKNLH
ncbi:MAG TPA: hypothetical protein PLG50_09665 [bacterium]|nr:hypothetical protein [bacterium]HQG45915.1 hypothetical protein [bacterium]HQI48878.1 hypothetical protein [bacterium]HQJ66133.1 hypothetical protein [bacterium]